MVMDNREKNRILFDTLIKGTYIFLHDDIVLYNDILLERNATLYKHHMYEVYRSVYDINPNKTYFTLKFTYSNGKVKFQTIYGHQLLNLKGFKYRDVNSPHEWIQSDTLFNNDNENDNVHNNNQYLNDELIAWGFGDVLIKNKNIKTAKDLNTMIEKYKENTVATLYSNIDCPYCNKSIEKLTYNMKFCSIEHKDKFHNLVKRYGRDLRY